MKKSVKHITTLLIVLSICYLSIASAGAALPYKGYTYNQWGQSVQSPNGYVPEKFISGEDCHAGAFYQPQDIFIDRGRRQIFIADTGNNRIVVLDEFYDFSYQIAELTTSSNGTEYLNSPNGVYVDDEGAIFIADTQNARIVKCDIKGKILNIIGVPVNAAFGNDFNYLPMKVVVDRDGLLYVQARNVPQGIICMDQKGNFIQFFGSNKVDVTAQVLFEQMLRAFMTKEQRKGMLSFVPIEYSNLYMTNSGFIFATVSKSLNSLNEIKKLNSKGDNILRVNSYGNSANYPKNNYGDYPVQYLRDGTTVDTRFMDVAYDDNGIIYALDTARGRVFVYDDESNLMCVFGTLGTQLGSFSAPASLEKFDDRVIVLDSNTNGFTLFRLTEFGVNVENAIKLYSDGKFLEAIEPWKMVLNMNSNYNLAYIGLGKAYLRLQQYELAMKYFKIGYDKIGYSKAQAEYFVKAARNHMLLVLSVFVILGIAPFALPSIIATIKKKRRNRNG